MVLLLVFLLFSSSLQVSSTTAIHTLALGQSLPWNETLVSKGGNFELGLFSPGNSSKHYIGIWYKKISKRTVVWVANRENPIVDPSTCRFMLSVHGELALLTTPSDASLWSSSRPSSSPPPRATFATLQDDGNLVVWSSSRNATSTSSRVTWQSFDHPTDTWLPGARLGYDRGGGVHSFLTSWTDSENPAPGAFTMEIDARGQPKFDLFASASRGAGAKQQYWTTGLWDGEIFANVPEMRSGYFAGIPYAPNASVNFFSYRDRIPAGGSGGHGGIGVGNFMLDVNGQMRRRQWSEAAGEWILFCSEPHDACDVYGSCGPFGLCSNATSPACRCPSGFAPRSEREWSLRNTASGCERRSLLECPKDGFLKLPYAVQLPGGSAEAAGVRNERDCERSCLKDCSCTAYVYDGAKCALWNSELVNMRTLSNDQSAGDRGLALHLRVARSDVPAASSSPAHSWKKSMVILGSVVAVVALLLGSFVIVVAAAVVLRMRRGKGKVTAMQQGSLLVFDYRALRTATRNFSEKLGGGSFGTVFKGALPDATVIAVKKLDGFRQGEKQFRAEVVTLGMVQHVNLVRLRGFCSEGNKRALVYDYMPNGSLDAYLFKAGPDDARKVLSWGQRHGVALGVARGLAYLHEKCRERIIHCDIKPENILLDDEMGARLADFGMAKLVGRDFSRVLTTMRGTLGYLAPEWLAGGTVTAKADVYSFGLLLFELVSGRRNNAPSSEEGGGNGMYFPVHAAVSLHGGDVVGLLDERLAKDADVKELERVCRVACWCIQDEEGDRPTMGLVVQQLEGVADVELPPIPSRLHMLATVNPCAGGGAEDEFCSKGGTSKLATEEV